MCASVDLMHCVELRRGGLLWVLWVFENREVSCHMSCNERHVGDFRIPRTEAEPLLVLQAQWRQLHRRVR